MNKILIYTIGIIFSLICKESKAQFKYDSLKTFNQNKYSYKYDSDQLISTDEDYNILDRGQIVLTIKTRTDYEYNNKGLLIKDIYKADFEDKPQFTIYEYNSNDSLTRELTISSSQDTLFWKEYKYYSDGRKLSFKRTLNPPIDQDILENIENIQYDTILFRNDYEYINGLCQFMKQYDQNNELIKRVQYQYENDKLFKEIHYKYINNTELIDKTKTYNYSKSITKPDYYSINASNDTIEAEFNEFYMNSLLTSMEVSEKGEKDENGVKRYYEEGKVIGIISFFKEINIISTESLTYNIRGELVQTRSYNEKINAL